MEETRNQCQALDEQLDTFLSGKILLFQFNQQF